MKKRTVLPGLAIALPILVAASGAGAEPLLRAKAEQGGDFLLIGNTLGHECRRSTPEPIEGGVGSCGTIEDSIHDSSPDMFWRADSPAPGQAEADASITEAEARTAAVLELPADAAVTHAFLYWSGRNAAGVDDTVTFDREGGFSETPTAIQSWQLTVNQGTANESHVYQSVADVTDIVAANGAGAYRVGGVDVVDIVDVDDARTFVGWWMVVFYQAPGMPARNLALFDGYDRVSQINRLSTTLTGIQVPDEGFEAKLGVVAFEGDNNIKGDRLFLNPSSDSPPLSEALGDAMNPPDNFFNGTRTLLGRSTSVPGDLPRLTGEPQSMPGVDIDIVDITGRLSSGMTSIPVIADAPETEGEADLVFIGGWVTSIGEAPGAYVSGSGVFGICSARPGAGAGGAGFLAGAALLAAAAARRRRR